ncbi:MAG: sulfate adenylyltransferase [Thermoplasmata archaeon]|nr:sulfate adenylyltransferase [Thermoplasmata archaeon]
MLPLPYGDRLVNRELSPVEAARIGGELSALPQLHPEAEQLYDAAQIARGGYSPLDGFMGRGELQSVLAIGRLPDGRPWPLPILLTPPGRTNAEVIARVRPGDDVALLDDRERLIAVLRLREKFPLERGDVATAAFGTRDVAHPNVRALNATGATVLAGRVDLVRPPAVPVPRLELSPSETRAMFQRRGWSSVAAFQTRNVPHRGHERLHRLTLERGDIDGLLIHPVVGPRQAGDYPPELVTAAYEAYLRGYLPAQRVALATLTVGMRYAGPKAALLFAIVRRNYGCSHYIVGRDQAGVGDFYDAYAAHRIFDEFPVGIEPLRYQALGFCPECGEMVSDRSCGHPKESRRLTSQTLVRNALRDGTTLPEGVLRPEVEALLGRPGRSPPGGRDPSDPGPSPGGTAPERLAERVTIDPRRRLSAATSN